MCSAVRFDYEALDAEEISAISTLLRQEHSNHPT